jgi:hypothetical protein
LPRAVDLPAHKQNLSIQNEYGGIWNAIETRIRPQPHLQTGAGTPEAKYAALPESFILPKATGFINR